MNDSTTNLKPIKIAIIALAGFFSFLGAMLAFFTDFGWWNVGYSWSYYFFIGSEMAPFWAQLFLVLLALIFLLNTLVAILLMLGQFGKIPVKFTKLLNFGGIAIAVITFIFTPILVGLFAIIAAGDWWGLSTSFYSSLICSILIGIFYILALVLKLPEDALPAK
jgi:hypothetical protein